MWRDPMRAFRRFLPTHTGDLFGTLSRVLNTGDPAARAEIGRTVVAALVAPLDLAASVIERRLYEKATAPDLPIVIVCGPARSGTSLTAQVLIRQLPVSYFSNAVGLFGRSPVVATRALSFALTRRDVSFSSFYGKSRRLSGPNDALHLWDRWFGGDRNRMPDPLNGAALASMSRFFGAWQRMWHVPLVAKNNQLYAYGESVARALPTAHFLCLQRDPVFLAQSQLVARQLLLGRADIPYGISTPEYEARARPDRPAQDACAQVAADLDVAARTRRAIGESRFWMVSYEQFCDDPNVLLERLSREVLHVPYAPMTRSDMTAIRTSSQRTVSRETFDEIVKTCERMGLPRRAERYFP